MRKPRVLLHDDSLAKPLIGDLLLTAAPGLAQERQSSRRREQLQVETRLRERRLILKCYIGARRGIERFRPLSLTRAWRSYHAAQQLRDAGIATPEPRFLAVWNQNLILGCDWIEARQLYDVIRDPESQTKIPALAEELAGLLRKLDRGGITHGDLHPRNILIDGQGKSWLVDLDAVRIHRSRTFFLRKRRRDEHRLARELEVEPRLFTRLGIRREGDRWTL